MELDDAHRCWLAALGRSAMLTWQVTGDFCKVFQLSGEQAGVLLAQWANECYKRM